MTEVPKGLETRVAVLERVVMGDPAANQVGLVQRQRDILSMLTELKRMAQTTEDSVEHLRQSVMGDIELDVPPLRQSVKEIDTLVHELKEERDRWKWLYRIIVGVGLGNIYVVAAHLAEALSQ